MRKLLLAFLITLSLSGATWSQTKKVTQMTADTTPTSDDLTMTVNDPGGTPANRKVTLANLFFAMAPWNVCTDAGSTDTYACSFSPAPSSYVSGVTYRFVANTVNTGAATINFNSLGAKTIKKLHDQDLADGDIESGSVVVLVYDGTNMQMVSQIANAPTTAAPTTATYITQTADATLSAEQAMGSLATGIVKNTTTTGVQSIATVDDISSPLFCSDAGANDTYTCSLSPTISSYVTGTHYRFKANTANTGAATINLNSIGAKTIKKAAGGITTDLADNDIRAGQWVDMVYDGTNMQMQSTSGNTASGGTTINSTDGIVPYRTSATTFADSPLKRVSADAVQIDSANANLMLGLTGGGAIMQIKNVSGEVKILDNGGSSGNIVAGRFKTGDALIENGTGIVLNYNAPGNGGDKMGWTNGYFDTNGGIRNEHLIRLNGNTSGNATLQFPPYSPAQITADTNDWNGSGQTNLWIRFSTDASRNFTGFRIPAAAFGDRQQDGEVHVFTNVGSFNGVFKHQDAGSTAANRFLFSTGADITVVPNQSLRVIYDGTTQRWRDF